MDNGIIENKPQKEQPRICLELRHIKKDYYVDKKPFTAIKDLSLCFPQKGFIAILGHSGSGKTTLLNIIGGLDHYTEGDLLIDGVSTKDYKDADWDNYRNRRIGFVFQTYNLIPHLSILQNVVMAQQLGGASKKEREEKALSVLEKVGLGEYARKRPNQLSGGQMQRVAIARALVNDPDIILADEPTGALDSATSVQVMDLIREVGKDRCVILVTHNRELANEYAERIIEMKDGEILRDTNPLEPAEQEPNQNVKGKRTSMSFLTALGSSARNIRTKKGRTILTAIACSFGIIGVALVLATSNGFSKYVSDVEVSIASSVPVSINPVTYQINTQILDDLPPEYPDTKEITVYDTSNTFTTAVYNDLTPEYFQYLDAIVEDPKCSAYGSAASIMYNRNSLNFHFLVNAPEGVRSLNQYSSAGSFGSAINSVTSLPSTILHELYGDESAMSSLYEPIEGRYPKSYDEMAIVVDRYNRIDFSTMRKLGFYQEDKFSAVTEANRVIPFSDILYKNEQNPGKFQYKCYLNSNYYQLPSDPTQVESMLETVHFSSHNNIGMTSSGSVENKDLSITLTSEPGTAEVRSMPEPNITEVYQNDAKYHSINMKIVGVLRPTPTSYISLMPASLAYTPALSKMMAADIEPGKSSYVLGEAQRHNWYIGRSDEQKNDGLYKMQTAINSIVALLNERGNMNFNITGQDISEADLNFFLNIRDVLSSGLTSAIAYASVTGRTSGGVNHFGSIGGFLGWCKNFGAEFEPIKDTEDLMNVLSSVLDQAQGGLAGFMDPANDTGVMDVLAYINSYSLISSVLIFPKSLTTKDAIHQYLDKWNADPHNSQIVYNDVMQDLMGGLGTMISVISAVLIVFASISLVVSSVMTAIITYVSVIERTKEIGVLRAVGARKKDVSRLFEAECVIIGGIAGVIGVAFTIIVCFPINAILNNAFPGNNLGSIAQLNPWHGLLLFAISIALAFVSGFIPSRIAAKRDPVVCLRSE